MLSNTISYILCMGVLFPLLIGLLGLLLGWLLWGRKTHVGDLTSEGEAQLRAEADGLRARINELESHVGGKDSEISDLKAQLSAAPAAATAVAADDDET